MLLPLHFQFVSIDDEAGRVVFLVLIKNRKRKAEYVFYFRIDDLLWGGFFEGRKVYTDIGDFGIVCDFFELKGVGRLFKLLFSIGGFLVCLLHKYSI